MPAVIDQLPLGPLETNCYLVRVERGAPEALVVDPSGSAADVLCAFASHAARCAAILVTHGHFDHILGLAELAESTGAPVYGPAGERALLETPDAFTPPGLHVRPCVADTLLEGGESLDLAGLHVDVLAVPGHSPGHLAYAVDGALLSGDVLFAGSVGRTDFPGGDWPTLLASIGALVERFPPETIVHPGHGPSTTLGAELARNPFLAELRETGGRAAG